MRARRARRALILSRPCLAKNVRSFMLDMPWPCRVLESLAAPYLVSLIPFLWRSLVINSLSTDSLATPRLCVVAQDRRVHMQLGQNGFILNPALCLCIYPWCVLP
jgi:hypothetical protein